ncbi:MAG: hypothetical protein AAF849_21535 [Bacteroidota bacterium]
MNLSYKVDFGGGNTIEWLYDAAGIKLRKTVKENSVVRYTQDYVGGIEYRDSEVEAIYIFVKYARKLNIIIKLVVFVLLCYLCLMFLWHTTV